MADASRPPRAFVCGHPVAHSRSPLIHGHWLREHGLSGSYVAEAVAPEGFAAFLGDLAGRGFVGGNVTVPHKEAAFALCDEVTPAARAIGAVNTVWLEGDVLHGTNTDAVGFLANLDAAHPGWDAPHRTSREALVLGAGGAARAVVHGLAERGFDTIIVANRTLARAHELRAVSESVHAVPLERVAIAEAAAGASLIVNTTSVGMQGKGDATLPVAFDRFADDTLATDIVYTPLVTPFLAAAKARGLSIVDGLGMLLHQAVPGFERWFGVRPRVTTDLRRLVLQDMGLRDHD